MNINQYTVISSMSALSILILILFSVQHFMGRHGGKKVKYGALSLHSLFGISFICAVIDAVWGMYDAQVFVSKTGFMIASVAVSTGFAAASYFWYAFLMAYSVGAFDRPINKGMALLTTIPAIVSIVISLSTPFTGAFCQIDSVGNYYAGELRIVFFLCLYFYLALLLVNINMIRRRYKSVRHGRTFFNVVSFITPMVFCEILQFRFPEFPFFTVGYAISALIVFVAHLVKYDEDRLRSASLSYKTASAEIYSALEALGDTYVSLHLLDLPMGTFETIKTNPILERAMKGGKNSNECMKLIMNDVVNRSNIKSMLEFVDLDTLSDRMKGERMIFEEFLGVNIGWCVSSFIRVESDQYGNLVKVIHAVQSVNSFKRIESEQNRSINSELIEKQTILNNLVSISTCGLIAADGDMNVLAINDAGAKLLGYKNSLCTPDRMRDLMQHTDFGDVDEALKLYKDATDYGIPFTIEFKVKLGENQMTKVHGDVRRIKLSEEKNAVVCAFTRV